MTKIAIGKTSEGKILRLDIATLIKTRLLVTANSGGGKSWLLRLLFEQLGKSTQLIVLDREGEFVSLREKLDVLLVGPQGEIPTDIRSAGLLVRRLMEKQISAVIDMSELPIRDQRRYVRAFLEAMISLPKSLWHPCFLGLDETHLFCPEKGSGESESTDAVNNLATLGRKRGFCPIFATQRISKFNKDAAAELLNKFIGPTTLDVDRKRAGDELGLKKGDELGLRDLEPGEFYCFGPAIDSNGVTRMRAGEVETTHPEPGQGRTIEPPKPSRAIQSHLDGLKDLPQQADEEAKTLADAKRQIADLQRKLNAKPAIAPLPPSAEAIERAKQIGAAERDRQLQVVIREHEKRAKSLVVKLNKVVTISQQLTQIAHVNGDGEPIETPAIRLASAPVVTTRVATKPVAADRRPIQPRVDTSDVRLGKCERAVLTALYWLRDEQAVQAKVAFYAGYSVTSSGFTNALSALRTAGFLDRLTITEEGSSLVESWDTPPKPSGQELRTWLRPKLGRCENAVLDALCEAHPQAVPFDELAPAAGYSPTSSGFTNALSTLRTIEAIEGYARDGGAKASDVFFD